MESTQEQIAPVTAATPEELAQKGVQNTLGVIKVVENLFNGLRAGSYPLHVTENVQAGMQFLAQFHSQLVSQLPAGLVEEMRKAQMPPAAATEVPSEPVKA